MTLVLELKPETLRRIEAEAAKTGTTPQQMLVELAEANFDRKDNEDGDAQFDAAMNRVFTKYHRAFEVLAEGAK